MNFDQYRPNGNGKIFIHFTKQMLDDYNSDIENRIKFNNFCEEKGRDNVLYTIEGYNKIWSSSWNDYGTNFPELIAKAFFRGLRKYYGNASVSNVT